MTSERQAYIYLQLPGTLNTVPAALLKVEQLPDGIFVGRFRYGDRYLERKDVSEHAGVVRQILVENGQPVEYGQVLFIIE